MLSGVNVLMAITIAGNINNRKPEGRFSTFNLDLIEKGVHAGRPAAAGAQAAASWLILQMYWRDIFQSKILFLWAFRAAERRRFESLRVETN